MTRKASIHQPVTNASFLSLSERTDLLNLRIFFQKSTSLAIKLLMGHFLKLILH
jgi:hypothetical protein